MSPTGVEFPQHTPTESGYDDGGVKEMARLILETQMLEGVVNWPVIQATPDRFTQPTRDQFIGVDLPRLAGIARETTRFPFSPTNVAHVAYLAEEVQRFGDLLVASAWRFKNRGEVETGFESFMSDDRNISLGMTEQVRQETLTRYRQLATTLARQDGIIIADGVRSPEGVIRVLQRIEDNQFSYYELQGLQDLAGLIESPNSFVRRIAVDLIDIWAENPSSMHKVYLFPMAGLAAEEGVTSQRLALLICLAGVLKTTTYKMMDGKVLVDKAIGNRMDIIAKTLALLRHSQLTPEIEGNLAGLVDKMLDTSTYPREANGARDREGHVLTKSSDIDGLILIFLGLLRSQGIAAGSLPARLLHVAADRYTQVNGAFIAVVILSLRQLTSGGTNASYYADPLFKPSVREKLAKLRFSPDNVNAVDAFLEHEVHDATRCGTRSRRLTHTRQIGHSAAQRHSALTRRSRVLGIARGPRTATRFRA